MKAIRVANFGGPEVLEVSDLPDPNPGPGEILVCLHAIGVNPVETYIRSGNYARLPELPFTPGTDGAGVVLRTGPGVSSHQPGDRVFLSGSLSGTYAELTLCRDVDAHPLPANASFAAGAALGIPYATAYRALFHRGRVQAGETLLIHGASGGVGSAALQLATAAGLRVFATAGSPAGQQLVRDQGAAAVFDHHDPATPAAITAATDGRGVDCILEMLANRNLGQDLKLLAPHGRVVVVGSRGPVEIDPRDTMMRDADVRGMILGNASPDERAEITRELTRHLAADTISPVIAREFPLALAADAHRAVMTPGATGKIILVP